MPSEYKGDDVHLSGECGIEDVEEMAEFMASRKGRVILDAVTHIHGAVFQAIALSGWPCDLHDCDPFVAQVFSGIGETAIQRG